MPIEHFATLFASCRIGGTNLESKGVSFDANGKSFTSVDHVSVVLRRSSPGVSPLRLEPSVGSTEACGAVALVRRYAEFSAK